MSRVRRVTGRALAEQQGGPRRPARRFRSRDGDRGAEQAGGADGRTATWTSFCLLFQRSAETILKECTRVARNDTFSSKYISCRRL